MVEQKVVPQNIRCLGNVCENFTEDDFTKFKLDLTLQNDATINNTKLRCFRVQILGTELKITSITGDSTLTYGTQTSYSVCVKEKLSNQAVNGLTVGLYVNNQLLATGVTNSSGYASIDYTPYLHGDVTLEFKVLPQQSYAMVKGTKSVTVNVATVITVFSPYIALPNNSRISTLGAWVTTVDGEILTTTLTFNYNGRDWLLDSRTSRDDDSLLAMESIPVGTSITLNYRGSGIYQSSSVTFNTGFSGSMNVAIPPQPTEITITDPNPFNVNPNLGGK